MIKMNEFELIDLIKDRHGSQSDSDFTGIGDDCAVVPLDCDRYLLLTTDMLVEDIHFKREFTSACQLGYKSLAVNLSDIAAMGGKPREALISIAIPDDLPPQYIDEFYTGLNEIGSRFDVKIAGGDTVKSNQGLIINVALTGEIHKDKVLYRSGAKSGDLICVTGNLGNSSAGLNLLQNNFPDSPAFAELVESHLTPYPQVKPGQVISESGLVHAMIDISDGLSSDLNHICQASDVCALIYEEMLPLSGSFAAYTSKYKLDYLKLALSGGEDYCLLLTVPADKFSELSALLSDSACDLHNIGEINLQKKIEIVRKNGNVEPLKISGWDHFRH